MVETKYSTWQTLGNGRGNAVMLTDTRRSDAGGDAGIVMVRVPRETAPFTKLKATPWLKNVEPALCVEVPEGPCGPVAPVAPVSPLSP